MDYEIKSVRLDNKDIKVTLAIPGNDKKATNEAVRRIHYPSLCDTFGNVLIKQHILDKKEYQTTVTASDLDRVGTVMVYVGEMGGLDGDLKFLFATCLDLQAMRTGMPTHQCFLMHSAPFLLSKKGTLDKGSKERIRGALWSVLDPSRTAPLETATMTHYLSKIMDEVNTHAGDHHRWLKPHDFYVSMLQEMFSTMPIVSSDLLSYVKHYSERPKYDDVLDVFLANTSKKLDHVMVYGRKDETHTIGNDWMSQVRSAYDTKTAIYPVPHNAIYTSVIYSSDTFYPHRITHDMESLSRYPYDAKANEMRTNLDQTWKDYGVPSFQYPKRHKAVKRQEEQPLYNVIDSIKVKILNFVTMASSLTYELFNTLWFVNLKDDLPRITPSLLAAAVQIGWVYWVQDDKGNPVEYGPKLLSEDLGSVGGSTITSTVNISGRLPNVTSGGVETNTGDSNTTGSAARIATLKDIHRAKRLPFDHVPLLDVHDGTPDQMMEDSEYASWFMAKVGQDDDGEDPERAVSNVGKRFIDTIRRHALEPRHENQFYRVQWEYLSTLDASDGGEAPDFEAMATKTLSGLDRVDVLQMLMAIRKIEQTHLTHMVNDTDTKRLNAMPTIISLLYDDPASAWTDATIISGYTESLDVEYSPINGAIRAIARFYETMFNSGKNTDTSLEFIESAGILRKIKKKARRVGRSAKRSARRAKAKVSRVVEDTSSGIKDMAEDAAVSYPQKDTQVDVQQDETAPPQDDVQAEVQQTETAAPQEDVQSNGGFWDTNW